HAGIDCSDGLSLDLSRLCQASGCGAVLDLERIPIAPAAVELCENAKSTLVQPPHPGPLPEGEGEDVRVAGVEVLRAPGELPLGAPVGRPQPPNRKLSPLDHALSDGEDFELIFAVDLKAAERMLADQPLEGVALTDIGQFVAEPGLWHIDKSGNRQSIL